jgi:hypothetical protein
MMRFQTGTDEELAAAFGMPNMAAQNTIKEAIALMYHPYLQPTESTKKPPRNRPIE